MTGETESRSAAAAGASGGGDDEKTRFALLLADLLIQWRTIIGITVGAVVLAIILLAARPDSYRATTVLYIPQGGSSPEQLIASQIQGSIFGGPVSGGGSANAQLITLLLSSRSLRDSVRSRFDGSAAVISEPPTGGAITVSVEHSDPELAAVIANTVPDLLNSFVAGVSQQSRRQREGTLERQLVDASANLEAAEKRAIEFQQTTAGPGLEQQLSASLSTAIRIQQQIAEQEILIQRLRRAATPTNPELQAAEAELAARRRQLDDFMERGGGRLLLPSFEESPELQVRGMRIMRDLTEAQEIYSSVSAALSSLRVTGHEDAATVAVIDPARAPTQPVPAKTWLVTLAAFTLGALLSIALVLARRYARHARRDPSFEPLFTAWDQLKADIRSVIPKRGRDEAGSEAEA